MINRGSLWRVLRQWNRYRPSLSRGFGVGSPRQNVRWPVGSIRTALDPATGWNLREGGGDLFATAATHLGAETRLGLQDGRPMEPSRNGFVSGERGSLAGEVDEDVLGDFLGQAGVSDLSQSGGEDQVHMPAYQGTKRRFRSVPCVRSHQIAVGRRGRSVHLTPKLPHPLQTGQSRVESGGGWARLGFVLVSSDRQANARLRVACLWRFFRRKSCA